MGINQKERFKVVATHSIGISLDTQTIREKQVEEDYRNRRGLEHVLI